MRFRLIDRILFGFGLVFLANLVALGYGTLVFFSIESKAVAIEKKWVPATRLVRDVTYDLLEIRSSNLGHVIFHNSEAMDAFENRRNQAIKRATANLASLKGGLAGTAYAPLADAYESQLREFVTVTDRTITLSRAGDKAGAHLWVQNQGTPVFDAAVASSSTLLQAVDSEAERSAAEAQALTGRARSNLLWAAGLSLAWTVLIGSLLSVTLSKPLRVLTKAARQVAGGRLSEVEPVAIRDPSEVGLLAEAFNFMVGRLRIQQEGLEELVSRRTAQLEIANQELIRANKHKSQFLAGTTHELRTPLTLILGYGEDVLDETAGPLNERQRRYLEKMHSSARSLLDLVNELLDFSRIEAGKMKLEYAAFPIGPFLEELAEKGRVLASKVGLLFEAHLLQGRAEDRICGDRARLGQVILNLLANAAKFTTEGGQVSLNAWVEPDLTVIEVKDTGIGIDPASQRLIFEAFEQGPAPVRPNSGGVGLGLPLARRLVELHGGTIEVDSLPDRGSRFIIRIPRWPDGREEESENGGDLLGNPGNDC